MVQNVFQFSIYVLRTNNGREYFSDEFNTYLIEHNIIYQSSCPYDPQQNGIAEMKNRHLLETARAMMFATSVPNSYWGEAVLTSAYLINCLPSKILKFRTSLVVLLDVFPHHARVLNSLTPHVFGCIVFVHQNPSTPSKLDPTAIKCIFVGYSPTQQGYKCYNPSTHKFVVSFDVSFLENQHFFQPHSQPAHVIGYNSSSFSSYC